MYYKYYKIATNKNENRLKLFKICTKIKSAVGFFSHKYIFNMTKCIHGA